ncbi:MAG TPA: DNA repair ATPase, partial [Polyangiaceae bacterium]|nr:DNA repair ATPase [Polyangiaceae bacterium]
MADGKDTKSAPATTGSEGLDGGSYEVIRARLVAQAKELADRTHALNARRQKTFGGTELAVVANERVRTENNCVPADILQVGGHLLLGYNVFFGLKKEVALEDVFSLQSFDPQAPEGQGINPVAPGQVPGLLDSENFTKEFTDLYRYYKD